MRARSIPFGSSLSPGIAASLLLLCAPAAALAQPTLASLWPNKDGSEWQYRFTAEQRFDSPRSFSVDATMRLDGFVQTPGGPAQVLLAQHPIPMPADAPPGLDPLLRAVWRARPDLRAAIASKAAASAVAGLSGWWPLLLHPGPFLKHTNNIQMWQLEWSHPTWTYLQVPIEVGATFIQQLLPELADDLFLHGTVESIDASVVTDGGVFEHTVRMGYLIDYGWFDGTDEQGNILGQIHSETRGHVHYAPDVGPVEMLEDFFPYVAVDCGLVPCPPAWTEHLGESYQTLTLSLTRPPVSIAQRTWGEIKSIFR